MKTQEIVEKSCENARAFHETLHKQEGFFKNPVKTLGARGC